MAMRRSTLTKYRQKKLWTEEKAKRATTCNLQAKASEMADAEFLRRRDRVAQEVAAFRRRACPHCRKDRVLRVMITYPYSDCMDAAITCLNPKCRTDWHRSFGGGDFAGSPTWISKSCWQGFLHTKFWFARAVANALMEEPDAEPPF